MIFSWWRQRRRRRLLATPVPAGWEEHLHSLPFFGTLDPAEQRRLLDDARILVAEKHWEGCGGLQLNEQMQVVIAAQAALLLLHIEHQYYRRTQSILVYPSTFVIPDFQRTNLVRGGHAPVLGLAQSGGPVVLAWDSVLHGAEQARDGRNVVLHEFAHVLDMLDQSADGTPPLDDRGEYATWARVMSREFKKLKEDDKKGRRTLLDKYGATNAAEFFAVVTECFFEKPRLLRDRHAELYGIVKEYYQQDPAERERPRR